MVGKALFSSDSTEWGTPTEFFDKLNQEFRFTLDVCGTHENAKVKIFYDRIADGLKQPWDGACWMNPPYGEPEQPCKPGCKKKRCAKRGHIDHYVPGIIDWVKKASEESAKGATVVSLLPSRTDTGWFHDYIWDQEQNMPREGVELRLLKGRLKFEGAENSAPFPSMLVIYRPGVSGY